MGSHAVFENMIITHYQRSIDLLLEAIQFTNCAYIFNHLTHAHIWLVEITNRKSLEMKTNRVPLWFKKPWAINLI